MKRAAWVLPALALALLLAACSSGGNAATVSVATTLESATGRGEFGVGVTTIELVDDSRPTDAAGDAPASDSRTLPVEVWYPAGPSATAPEQRDASITDGGGPHPLIVFAHGLAGSRRQSVTYTQHLASHGYIVVAPDFPLSNGGAPGGPRVSDLVNQPGDVSFLIDQFLAFNDEEGHLLEGAVDADSVGLTGHSLGGFTTLLTVYGENSDERIDAALPISASGCSMDEATVADVAVPIMLLTGSEDLLVAPAGNRRAYDLANAPRYWVELQGANHIRFADVDIEDGPAVAGLDRLLGREPETGPPPTPEPNADPCQVRPRGTGIPTLTLQHQQELLRAFAVPFFDAYLRESDGAKDFLQDELAGLVPEARFEFDAD
jgi:predicted dienelactone hydrolase